MRKFNAVPLALVCLASLTHGADAQFRAGAQGPEGEPFRRQLWLVPSQDRAVPMRTLVFRPPGRGPFPLAIINHGTSQSRWAREKAEQPAFPAATQWFVQRGYAVALPQRPGHGATGGPYLEAIAPGGRCDRPDYLGSGLATADSIQAAIEFFVGQPFVRKTGIVVVGHSAGGWGALALAGRNPPGVAAAINFSGGRGGRVNNRPDHNCAPERLIEAARSFAAGARVPVLSIYARNDSFFGPELARKISEAFRDGGGRIELHLLPPLDPDGHMLLALPQSVPVWGPLVETFLQTALQTAR